MALKHIGPKPKPFRNRSYSLSQGYWRAWIAGQSRNICRWTVTSMAEVDRLFAAQKEHYEALARDKNRDPVLNVTSLEQDHLTVKELVDRYLEARIRHVNHPDPGRAIAPVTFRNYQKDLTWLSDCIGAAQVSKLTPANFAKVIAVAEVNHAPKHISNIVATTRMMFQWALTNRIILAAPFYGSEFVSRNEALRQDGVRNKAVKLFTASQVRALLDHADPRMKAMIYLGINCAYLQSDCAELPVKFEHPTNVMVLDGDQPYIRFDRVKTGERRKATLWPETVAALKVVIGDQREGLVFMTSKGFPLIHQTEAKDASGRVVGWVNCDPVPKMFRELRIKAKLPGSHNGLGFSALRSTCQTVMYQCPHPHPAAIAWVMGHKLAGNGIAQMADRYLVDMDLKTLRMVTGYVHDWLFEGDQKGPSQPASG
jgi:integrase